MIIKWVKIKRWKLWNIPTYIVCIYKNKKYTNMQLLNLHVYIELYFNVSFHWLKCFRHFYYWHVDNNGMLTYKYLRSSIYKKEYTSSVYNILKILYRKVLSDKFYHFFFCLLFKQASIYKQDRRLLINLSAYRGTCRPLKT